MPVRATYSRSPSALDSACEEAAGAGDRGDSHDTIGLLCLDRDGNIAAATSTSGWKFKHPGRVGDAPLIGAGLYADNAVGGAVATGDGEDIMRACVASVCVERMRMGFSPTEAAQYAVERVRAVTGAGEEEEEELSEGRQQGADRGKMHRRLTVGVVALSTKGEVGAASTLGASNPHRGVPGFPCVVWREGEESLRVVVAADGCCLAEGVDTDAAVSGLAEEAGADAAVSGGV